MAYGKQSYSVRMCIEFTSPSTNIQVNKSDDSSSVTFSTVVNEILNNIIAKEFCIPLDRSPTIEVTVSTLNVIALTEQWSGTMTYRDWKGLQGQTLDIQDGLFRCFLEGTEYNSGKEIYHVSMECIKGYTSF